MILKKSNLIEQGKNIGIDKVIGRSGFTSNSLKSKI